MIPCDKIEASDVARMFLRYVWCNHGLPDTIVLDCSKQFVSAFYNELCAQLRIDPRFSTGHHPETDRQTENANAAMEQVLRAYTNY